MRKLSRRQLKRALGWTAVVAVAAYLVYHAGRTLPSCAEMQARIAGYGDLGWIAYLAGATLASLVFIPRTAVVVIAGLIFPPVEAIVLVTVSSMLSALLGFLFSRHFGRALVHRQMAERGWTQKLEMFVHKNELIFVTMTRLIHVLPYTGVNYALGVLPVGLANYLLGTFLGIIPGTLGLVYAGGTAGCLLVDREGPLPGDLQLHLIVGGVVLSALAVIPAWVAARRRK